MKKSSKPSKPKSLDLMETCNASPWHSVGKIVLTSAKPKEDVFASFRPDKKCVDYKISETWAKMQKGDLKVNVKHTVATYEDIPPEICKPQRRKKVKLFSGGPPQFHFIDEIWMEKVNEAQATLRMGQKKIAREARVSATDQLENKHAIVQRLVGPEWFMELSPKQLAAADQLQKSVYRDIRKNTTINCEEILAIIGLLSRPTKAHIKTALQQSRGSPIEFLLVLYQLINPKRDSYSLNDRLLLSSVVHLGLMSTLRELHVRIPSPPKEPKVPKVAKKKDKKKKYSSPYLEPLKYQPEPPRFSGIYKNKHKQYPENPYFAYIADLEGEKINNTFCIYYSMLRKNEEIRIRMLEYKQAQEFYESIPGVKQAALRLIPPTVQLMCPNMLSRRTMIRSKLIAPHLCKVVQSEQMVCFCSEKGKSVQKKIKLSSCEKNAQSFLGSLCPCDDCLEKVRQNNLVRVHGGFQKSTCECDEPVPIIQGTLPNRVCECYKEYRDRIVVCAARQRMVDQELKYIVGEVFLTKFGPVYTILGAPGEKICLCNEILQREAQVKKCKDSVLNRDAKFINGGITLTKCGLVYNLSSVIARKPCKCILRYKEQLEVLSIQNKVREHPVSLVNHGLICGQFGPIFHLSCVPGNLATKTDSELRAVCSCEIKKTKCFEHCMNYLDYKVQSHGSKSTSEESDASHSGENCSCDESSEESDDLHAVCQYCLENVTSGDEQQLKMEPDRLQRACQQFPRESPRNLAPPSQSHTTKPSDQLYIPPSQNKEYSSENESSESDVEKEKPCTCKDELDRFMKSKCPCEECNRRIRQAYATYIRGGTKITPSGQVVSLVQGIHQPLCSCLHDHMVSIKQIDEYKGRVKARYDLRKQPKKYCITGVRNTPEGPIYILSGIRPQVECECGKALREKEEMEAYEKQRAKLPDTGRIKYEISGVKAMPEENVYITSRALAVPPCKCERLLNRFEAAHKDCLEEFQKYMTQTEDETITFINGKDSRSTFMRSVDINFAQAFENYPSNMFMDHTFAPQSLITLETPKKKKQNGADVSPPEVKQSKEEASDAQTTQTYYEVFKTEEILPEVIEEEPPKKETTIPPSVQEKKDCACACSADSIPSKSEKATTSSADECSCSTSSDDSDSDDDSELGSCHVEIPPGVRPITLPPEKTLRESFLSKRFAIFRNLPKCKRTMMKILKHILTGMAEDGFPLAKLPEVYKLPIFKLWIELRVGTSWSPEDKITYYGTSKYLWKHTDICYKHPPIVMMPYSIEKARTMTWKHAKRIKREAAKKENEYYRNLKQITVDTGREFFATTYPYEFPTKTWRDCAFAYLPTKQEDLFPYKIVRPHEIRITPEHKKINCYC